MDRPLINLGAVQLEELLVKSCGDIKMMSQLKHELEFRKTTKAASLRAQVDAILNGTPGDLVPPISISVSQMDILKPLTAAPAATSPIKPAAAKLENPSLAAKSTSKIEQNLQQEPIPNMPIAEAHRIIKSTPATLWQTIESTRRQIVRLASPALTANLSPEKTSKLQREANLANDACKVIWAERLRYR